MPGTVLDTGEKHWESGRSLRTQTNKSMHNCKLQRLFQRELSPDPEPKKPSDGFKERAGVTRFVFLAVSRAWIAGG